MTVDTTTGIMMLINKVMDIHSNTECPTNISLSNHHGVLTIAIGYPGQKKINYEDTLYYKTMYFNDEYHDIEFIQNFPLVFTELAIFEKEYYLFTN